jgi:hypothetical protein
MAAVYDAVFIQETAKITALGFGIYKMVPVEMF